MGTDAPYLLRAALHAAQWHQLLFARNRLPGIHRNPRWCTMVVRERGTGRVSTTIHLIDPADYVLYEPFMIYKQAPTGGLSTDILAASGAQEEERKAADKSLSRLQSLILPVPVSVGAAGKLSEAIRNRLSTPHQHRTRMGMVSMPGRLKRIHYVTGMPLPMLNSSMACVEIL